MWHNRCFNLVALKYNFYHYDTFYQILGNTGLFISSTPENGRALASLIPINKIYAYKIENDLFDREKYVNEVYIKL